MWLPFVFPASQRFIDFGHTLRQGTRGFSALCKKAPRFIRWRTFHLMASSKRVLLPIASESPSSKRVRPNPDDERVTQNSTPACAPIDIDGEENAQLPGPDLSRTIGVSGQVRYEDIPEHLFTDAQHEDACGCVACQWYGFTQNLGN